MPRPQAADGASGLGRALAPSELLFVGGSGLFVGYSCLCVGDLDLAALGDAFAELQRQHPELRSVILACGRSVEFAESESEFAPAELRVFPDEDLLVQVTGRAAVFDQTKRSVYLDVIPSDGQARVTLFAHHAIADGHHGLALLEGLWRNYTRRIRAEEPPLIDPQLFPQSLEYHLATREHPGSGRFHSMPELPKDFGDGVEGSASGFDVQLPVRIRLSQAETHALLGLARAQKLGLNSLISAAIIRAHPLAGSPPFYTYPVDLRGRVTPNVGPTEATNMVLTAILAPDDSPSDICGLAHRISQQLAADLADGSVHTGSTQAQLFESMPSAVLTSTNWGRVPQLLTPSRLRIVDFQSFFPSNPPVAASNRVLGTTALGYTITTFEDRLSVETLTIEAGAQPEEHLAAILQELRALTRSQT